MAAAIDPYAHVDGDDDYIKVSAGEDAEVMEFPKEDDGTVMFSTIQTQYPDAIGIKYKGSSGAWRAIRAVDNVLAAPKGGWGDKVYCISVSDAKKRKADTVDNGVESKVSRSSVNSLLKDMAVIGLPYKTTNEELKEYFETNYGELAYSEVKVDRTTGKSRGFGFIRFNDIEIARTAANDEHFIQGRKVIVKQKQDKPMKMFIGRLPHGTTTQDLEAHFSQYGQLTDTYIPTPFRNFAFITFASTEDAKACMRETHVLSGARLNVEERKPERIASGNDNDNAFGNNFGNKRQGGGSGYSANNLSSSQNTEQTKDMSSDLKSMLFQFLASRN